MYSKINTESQVDTKIYVETPCGEKIKKGDKQTIYYEDEEYMMWEPTRLREAPNPL